MKKTEDQKNVSFDVMIMGAGRIASGFDNPNTEAVLTHAHAVTAHAGFRLQGFTDIDMKKAEEAAHKWQTKALAAPVKADVIVICSPDESHLENVIQAVGLQPKLIVLEKPIADNLESAEKIMAITKDIPVQVNFTRRFVPEIKALQSQDYGKFITGTGLYGKGYVHNGSHMIDLLRMILGKIKSVDVIRQIFDFFPNDSTKTAIITFENGGEFMMRGLDCRFYTVFEAELCFENARVKVSNGGERIQIEKKMTSRKFPEHSILIPAEDITTGIDKAIYGLYENVYEFLTGKTALLSPLETAFTKAVYVS